jgi:hypothetical protein
VAYVGREPTIGRYCAVLPLVDGNRMNDQQLRQVYLCQAESQAQETKLGGQPIAARGSLRVAIALRCHDHAVMV